MTGKLTIAEFEENLKTIWELTKLDSVPNTILVSPTTIKKFEATVAFNKRLRWWNRAFYWVFRGKARRDLQKWVTARVPENTGNPPPLSGLDAFLTVRPK